MGLYMSMDADEYVSCMRPVEDVSELGYEER